LESLHHLVHENRLLRCIVCLFEELALSVGSPQFDLLFETFDERKALVLFLLELLRRREIKSIDLYVLILRLLVKNNSLFS